MLSWRKAENSKPIARVDGGAMHNKTLYLISDFDAQNMNEIKDPLEHIPNSFYNRKGHRISMMKKNKLQQAILNKREPEDPEMAKMYNEAMSILNKVAKNEVILTNGKFVPLPNKNQSSERIYIAGKTGSGKSTYAANFIKEIKKSHPKMDFILFSKVDEDEVLDKLKPIRIKCNEDLLETKPIEMEELKKAICVFDDIDTFSNKKVLDYVKNLRDQLLQEGRHHKIYTICTSHLLSDYAKTRKILNEMQSCTLFPRMLSPHHLLTFLKKYAGLEQKEIQKIRQLPTRWCTINQEWPTYCLYETGCFLLGQPEIQFNENNHIDREYSDSESDTDSYSD